MATCRKIVNWKNYLNFPPPNEVQISDSAQDLIRRLICDSKTRLTFDEMKSHPFFKGINWDNIRTQTAALVPQVSGPTDSSNFDQFEEQQSKPQDMTKSSEANQSFVGYTYTLEDKVDRSLGDDFFAPPPE